MRGPSRRHLDRGQKRRPPGLAEVLEHQRGAPDRADGFAMPWPGCRAPSRARARRGRACRAGRDVRARGHAHAALQRGGDVGEDVAEEVRGDDDVEAVRVAHHARGEGVDEHALVADVRVLGRDLLRDLVPEHVAVARRVRLGRARHDAAPRRGELERVADDALDAARVKTPVSIADLVREPLVRAPADAGVLALGVLAHEEHVDVRAAAPPSGEGTPSSSRAGRMFAHRSRPWRIGQESPHRVTWSGTDGSPTAPSSTASWRADDVQRVLAASSRPFAWQWSAPQRARSTRCRGPSASTALRASATTSGPTPSPGITAIRKLAYLSHPSRF